MFPLSIRMNVQTLLVVFVITFAYGLDRNIKSQMNPGCSSCTTAETLVYIKAVGSSDTIHQIWDFTCGIPTIIFVVGSINSTLTILWDDVIPKEFLMDEIPRYSFAAAIDKVYEFDDKEDNGHYDPIDPEKAFELSHITWRCKDSSMTDREAMVKVQGEIMKESWTKGIIEIKLDLLPFKDYAAELPHLIHTANSTLVDVSLVNVTSWRRYKAPRLALHVILAGTDHGDMRYTMRKSLDDEHTPGVFEIVEIKTPLSYLGGDGGFLQFRPVAYTQRERGVTSSTLVHVLGFNSTELPQSSTIKAFYNTFDADSLVVQDMFVSFGESGDGHYNQHNYTAWSFTIGYGSPPIEGFSLFVLVIISVGLGVPVFLAMSGVLYVLVRRYRQRNSPTRFTDE